jgi:hypothetical protein
MLLDVVRNEVVDDHTELSGAAALLPEDFVCGRDGEESAEMGVCIGEDGVGVG